MQLLFYEKLGIRYDEKLNAEIKEVKTVYYADRKSINRFGLDTSIRGNMMAVSMTANTALSGMRFIRAVAK